MTNAKLPWVSTALMSLALAAPVQAWAACPPQDPERPDRDAPVAASQDPKPSPQTRDAEFAQAMDRLLLLLEQSAQQQDAVRAQLQVLAEGLQNRSTEQAAGVARDASATGASSATGGQLDALRERIRVLEAQQLETALVVDTALNEAAARLDALLPMLESIQPPPPGVVERGAAEATTEEVPVSAPVLQDGWGQQPWLLVVLVAGVLAIGLLTWRFQRERRTTLGSNPRTPEEGVPAEEIWGVAHLLSDAVGKMRGTAADTATEPTAMPGETSTTESRPMTAAKGELAAASSADHGALDLAGALSLDLGAEPMPAGPDENPHLPDGAIAEVANQAEQDTEDSALPRWRLRLPSTNPARMEPVLARYLAGDPRVLREPEPVLRSHVDTIEIECSLLPGLLDAERAHLRVALQRLLGSG